MNKMGYFETRVRFPSPAPRTFFFEPTLVSEGALWIGCRKVGAFVLLKSAREMKRRWSKLRSWIRGVSDGNDLCLDRRLRMAPFFGIALCGVALAGCATFRAQPVSPEQTRDQFNNRSLGDASLCRFLGTNQVSVPGKNETWDLRALTLVAFFYEPGLAEAREQLAAIQAAQITAGERPNPSVSVTPGYDIGIPGNPSPWLVTLTSDWPIETGGKRRKRMAQASHLAEAARWDLVGAIWQARSRVRAAMVALYAAGENESFLICQLAAQS